MSPEHNATAAAQAVRRTLWIVLVLNALVAAAKLIVGLLSGTVSMVADGFHATMDMSSNVIGLVSVQIAARPPDEDHPYGHQRYETLATLAIGGLMLVAAWEILQAALDRLLYGGQPKVTPVSFAVMGGTLAVNLAVTTYERRQGHKLGSPILLADAAHTASDIFVTLSVLVSLVAAALGFPWVDVVVALVIVGAILRVGLGIVGRSSDVLADRQVLDPQAVRRVLRDVAGVEQIVRVRSRGPESAAHVDVDVRIKPAVTADHAHAIAETIRERVHTAYPEVAEVQVHFAPQRDGATDYALEARAVADGLGLGVHEVVAVPTRDGVTLEMHVEVSGGLSLAEAHALVSQFEERLRARLPQVREVLTHIEPTNAHGPLAHMDAAEARALQERALAVAQELYPEVGWHHVGIRPTLGGYVVTMHCHLPPQTRVEEAHAVAERVETAIRSAHPQIRRVTIHTEPTPQ